MARLLRFFPHFLLFSLLIRILIVGASLGEAIIMLVFGSIYAGHEYLDHIREPEANKAIKDDLAALKESHESLKNKVSSVTLANTFRK
jgi:hypothetical protein